MASSHFRTLLAVTLGVVSMVTIAAAQTTPGDRDSDGVPDAQDACPDAPGAQAAPGEPAAWTGVQADGCGPFRALVTLVEGKDLEALAKDEAGAGQAQCYWSQGDTCSLTATLTLSASSAKKLNLKNRRIGDVTVNATKTQDQYALQYRNFHWGFSAAVKRALRHAASVTVTFAGTYTRGTAAPVKIQSETFKAVKNSHGRTSTFIPPRAESTDG